MNWEKSLEILKQLNIGSDVKHVQTMTSSVTTAWGVNWDEVLIARDLMQNFFDANRSRLQDVTVSAEGTQVTISAPAGFNLARLFYLGSEKGGEDVGQYGEGFKAAVMCLMRDHRVEPVAMSGKDIICFRISEDTVAGTGLRPIIYDFFRSGTACEGSRLILRGCPKKLIAALECGMDHFFHAGNSLLGERVWVSPDGVFSAYSSTTPGGHVFYRNLKRGEIPDIPIILIIEKEYAAIEKKIKNDRDRNAFGEALLKTFYSVFARHGVKCSPEGQRAILEAARHCWSRGHALLSEIADSQPWRGTCWRKADTTAVFGGKYYARCSSRNVAEQIRIDTVERQWREEGRQALPMYFCGFGLLHATEFLKEREVKAAKEAKNKNTRRPTRAEMNCVELLAELTRDLAPCVMRVLDSAKLSYCVAATETLQGELAKGREWRSHEVFLSASFFTLEFPEALAVFLHEHSHVFGYDGSRGFTDTLTELLGTVVRHRKELDAYESHWESAQDQVVSERDTPACDGNQEVEVLLASKDQSELRDLIARVPRPILKRLLQPEQEAAVA